MAASDPTTITSRSSLRSSLIFISFLILCSGSTELVSFLSFSTSLIGNGGGPAILIPASMLLLVYGDGER